MQFLRSSPRDKSDRVQSALIVSVAFAALAIYFFIGLRRIGVTAFDDAFMFTRYAKNFLDGNGFSWNAKDGIAYGSTSSLYLILVTLALAVTRLPDVYLLTSLSFIGGILGLLAISLMGFCMWPNATATSRGITSSSNINTLALRLMPLLSIPALAFSAPYLYHSFTGMETTWSFFMNSLFVSAVFLAWRSRLKFYIVTSALIGILAINLRPDISLYVIAVPITVSLLSEQPSRRKLILYFTSLLTGMLATLLLWKYLFGGYFPLPLWSKSSGFYKGYIGAAIWNHVQYLLIFYQLSLPFILFAFNDLPIRARKIKATLPVLIAILATFSYYSRVTQIMGFEARYYIPSFPFLVFVLIIFASHWPIRQSTALEKKDASLTSFPRRNPVLYLIYLILLSPVLFPWPFARLVAWQASRLKSQNQPLYIEKSLYKVYSNTPLPKLGWLKSIAAIEDFLSSSSPEITIAASEYGRIASNFPRTQILDLVGLHDKTIAKKGFSSKYVFSRQPDVIWLPHSDYTGSRKEILEDPVFSSQYLYYPGLFDYGIALRLGSPYYNKLNQALSKTLSTHYSSVKDISALRAVFGSNEPSKNFNGRELTLDGTQRRLP